MANINTAAATAAGTSLFPKSLTSASTALLSTSTPTSPLLTSLTLKPALATLSATSSTDVSRGLYSTYTTPAAGLART